MSRTQRIEEQAALWVVRREEPSWSPSEQAELDAWLAESDAHKVAYWRLECGWREADRIASLGAPLQPASRREARAWWQPLAIAASLLLVGALFFLQWQGLPFRGSGAEMQIATAVGGHKVVNLPDGSRVELNTDTAIRAALGGERRTVWLDRGEAFFDVAKGRPFVIHAGARTITVLGTKFSVRRDPSEVVVAVLEGRVQVDEAAAGPDRHATVTAGDVAIARDRSTLVTKSADAVEQQLAWRSGRLVLDGLTLAAAAEQFNRYNFKRLVIADAGAGRIMVGGTFPARNVDAFARMLETAYGLDARHDGARIVLASKRIAHSVQPQPTRAQISRKDAAAVPDSQCGPGGTACAVIPLAPAAPPPPPVEVASAPEKAVRDARNWSVLHKLYPPRALAAGEEGLVGFTVMIDRRGNPTQCKITHTSGHPLLDIETCKLIMVHATFKRPTGVSMSQQKSYEGVVNWKLPTTPLASVPPAPKPVAEAKVPEEMICRRIPQTGSNVAYERRCMTRSEWRKMSDESKENWNRLQGRGPSQ